MPKAYWIAYVDVHNDEGYKPYAAANRRFFANSAAALSYAAVSSKPPRARAAPATS